MPAIDLNADLGEGAAHDAELMQLISSANVCCGAHAGSPDLIRSTLELAVKHGVSVGAHPGYADRDNFGREELDLTPQQIRNLVQYQLGGLDAIARSVGIRVRYVKPHGALYNQACQDIRIAQAFCAAVYQWNIPIVGLPKSMLHEAAEKLKIPYISEGFADRRYRPDGSLVPRTEPNSQIEDSTIAVEQVKQLISQSSVRTICVHGDHPKAVRFAQDLRSELLASAWEIRAFA
jgi:5-oxoprolinase (ATP-hydrolysing) subunit A